MSSPYREKSRFRERVSLNGLWRFRPTKGHGHRIAASGWGRVKVPNWLGRGQFDVIGPDGKIVEKWKGLPLNGGKTEYNRWWFQRNFEPPMDWKGRQVVLHIQASAYMRVLVNGKFVGEHYGALTEYQPDVSDFIRFGEANVLSVFVANSCAAGRYTPTGKFHGGAGLWGDVYIEARPFVHVENVYIITSVRRKTIELRVCIKNQGKSPVRVRIANAIYNDMEKRMRWKNLFTDEVGRLKPQQRKRLWKQFHRALWQDKQRWGLGGRLLPPERKGRPVLRLGNCEATVNPDDSHAFALGNSWRNPKLWSPDHPHLYSLHTTLAVEGRIVDERWTRFGFREVWAENGAIYLNGKVTHLRGESAPTPVWGARTGLCSPTTRVLLGAIKDAGLNAVRFHGGNPSEIGPDIADEIGLLFIDESGVCFERPTDEAGWQVVESEFKAWIERDRNHPSVIVWSASNEIGDRHACKRLSSIIRKHDATRLVENEWIGQDKMGLSQIKSDDVDSVHYPPSEPGWGQKVIARTNKPVIVGECFFMTRDTRAIERAVKVWRACGINIMLFTPLQELSLEELDFSDKVVKHENLITPQPKPDHIVHCGIGECWNVIDPEKPPYEPNETGMLQTIMRVCGPILAYIGGPSEKVYEKRGEYRSGEKVLKTLVIINDTESEIRFRWRCDAGGFVHKHGTIKTMSGKIAKLPIVFKAPRVDKKTLLNISAEAKAMGKRLRDSVTITIIP